MATYCIICGKEKTGIPIENDYVLDALRWIKRNVTKNEQKNHLVVCKEDYTQHRKNINRYRSRQAIYLGIALLFALFFLAVSFTIGHLFVAIGVVIFFFLVSLLNYTPSLLTEKDGKLAKVKHKQ